jgi:Rps23 Pro-64 3,4-dihydroxylase Tpa1-like proline 4-hydroxylase
MTSRISALPYRVRRSRIHGTGVFATRHIATGTRIIEYVGERVSHREADRRYQGKDDDDNHTFLFTLDVRTVIDAGVGGNAARFINHSCDPNCEAVIDDRRIWIEAVRDIAPGAELCYDYLIERAADDPPNIEQIYGCRCGAETCRGTMLLPPATGTGGHRAARPTAAALAGRLVEALAGPGWGVVTDAVSPPCVRALAARVAELDLEGEFRAAAVGAGRGRAVRPQVRGDRIRWLDAPAVRAERQLLGRLETVRVALNRELQLGVGELDCHYAIYPAGAGYARHLDRSPAGAERVVSLALYLNESWSHGDGGELRLYADAGPVTILPRAGTLVAFMSERFEHEVRPAARERTSLSGWFRRRGAR